MSELELSHAAQQWVNIILIWVGFGTLAGLFAMLIVPVRQPSHPAATLILGISGSMLGLWGLSWLLQGKKFNPISPIGFLAAIVGSFLLLIAYRVCCRWFVKQAKE